MAIQMIICLETNSRSKTDYIYIKETLDYLYEINNQVKISPVYMDGKNKYQTKGVLREIAQKIKAFTIGRSVVFYCVDTDDYEKNTEHANEFHDIRQFCKKSGYEFIWFCHDIEEVFLSKKLSDSQKVREAGAFRNRKGIKNIPLERLTQETVKPSASNIVYILDQYLKRKQRQ